MAKNVKKNFHEIVASLVVDLLHASVADDVARRRERMRVAGQSVSRPSQQHDLQQYTGQLYLLLSTGIPLQPEISTLRR